MKKILFVLCIGFFVVGCSSKKILLVKKVIYNENVNHIASQYKSSQKPYNYHNNLKNRSIQNQEENYSNLSTCNNQKAFASKNIFKSDFLTKRHNSENPPFQNQEENYSNLTSHNDSQKILASKNVFESDFLTNRHNGENPPTINLDNRFNKLFIDKPQIFEKKKSSLKEPNIKDKIKKILKIIGVSILIAVTALISLFTVVLIAETKFNASSFLGELGFTLILISLFSIFCSYISIKKMKKSNSKVENKDDIKESID